MKMTATFYIAPFDPCPGFCRIPFSGVGPVWRLETLGFDVHCHGLRWRGPAGLGGRAKLPAVWFG